jgi:hypothetical protein
MRPLGKEEKKNAYNHGTKKTPTNIIGTRLLQGGDL